MVQSAKVRLIDISNCERFYRRLGIGPIKKDTNLCTITSNSVRDNIPYFGKGAPLLCRGIQIGIESWWARFGRNPIVWTRVDKFADWINDTTDYEAFARRANASICKFNFNIIMIFLVGKYMLFTFNKIN